MTRHAVLALSALLASASPAFGQTDEKTKTESSTTTKMPEDGGPLKRAPMPTGGVEDGVERSGQTGGVDDGMDRAGQIGGAHVGQHCHEHDHGADAHNHCHGHEGGPDHEHAHDDDEHCHKHQHDDGELHSHCHEITAHHGEEHCHEHQHDGGVPHKHCHAQGAHHGDEHCHSHEHDGSEHSHCHEEEHHAEGAAPGPEDHCHPHRHADGTEHDHCHQQTGDSKHAHPHLVDRPSDEPLLGVELGGGVRISWDGFLRVIAEIVENDPRSTFIGRNDGFRLGQMRLGTWITYEELAVYMSLEGAVGQNEGFNDPNQQFTVRPVDAFIRYDFSKFAGVQLGRFKAPYDYGFVKSSSARVFIDAPLETRGVLPTQGNEVAGFSPDRQLGIMISKNRVGLSEKGFDIGYAVALTNGRTGNAFLNDNDRPAGFGRLMAHYGQYVTLNLAGFTDSRTVGELPNLFDESVLGAEISVLGTTGLIADAFKLSIELQFLTQTTEFETSERPKINSYGAHAQWDFRMWDFIVGYRFAWLEPNSEDLDDADQVTEHTIAVGYEMPKYPLMIAVAGTVALEQAGRRVDNNRITLLTQFRF